MDHHHETLKSVSTDILVVGAGIAGITAALEAAETGFKVILVEKNPQIGGRIAQLNEYFPKLCPPTCGLEINVKRLRENQNVQLMTLTEVEELAGTAGDYTAKIKLTPRYIKDTATDNECEDCADNCNVFRKDEFNYGMSKTKAIYIPYNNCYPMKYIFDKEACSDSELRIISENCSVIDLDQHVEHMNIGAKAIIWASGWKPYDANKLETLGYKEYPNVVTNVELERLAAPNGPTGGKIEIPGNPDRDINTVVFVQCAGSRDENHLEYCSSVCCLASMKHTRYLRSQFPEADIHIFYIDVRSPGINEDFYNDTKEDTKVFWHRGKVAKVFEEFETKKLIVEAEDTLGNSLQQLRADMVVLATGMQPNTDTMPDKAILDESGFIRTDKADTIIGCGVATSPKDVAQTVQDATGAALKAIQIIKGGK
jgi:quinone-modifying oxidoreductase, subunit QmoA